MPSRVTIVRVPWLSRGQVSVLLQKFLFCTSFNLFEILGCSFGGIFAFVANIHIMYECFLFYFSFLVNFWFCFRAGIASCCFAEGFDMNICGDLVSVSQIMFIFADIKNEFKK